MNPRPTFHLLDSAYLHLSDAEGLETCREELGEPIPTGKCWAGEGGAAAKPIVRHEVQT